MDDQDKIKRARQAAEDHFLWRIFGYLGDRLSEIFCRFSIHPNVITLGSVVLTSMGGLFAVSGTALGFLICSVFLFLAYLLDFVDGRVARRKNLSSHFGKYLDLTADDVNPVIIAVFLSLGLWNAGFRNVVLLLPFLTCSADFIIKHTMTRYREAVIDLIPPGEDLKKVFQDNPSLKIARVLLPPINLRTVFFLIFGLLGYGKGFIIVDSIYTFLLAALLLAKVGSEIQKRD